MVPAIIFGRQPLSHSIRIAPSNPNPWYGSIIGGTDGSNGIEGGERFTVEQRMRLRERGLDPAQVETVTVKRNATHNEAYWGIGQVPPQFHFDCPVIGRGRTGKLKVICPAGWVVDVNPDGWSGKPGKPRSPSW